MLSSSISIDSRFKSQNKDSIIPGQAMSSVFLIKEFITERALGKFVIESFK